MVPYSKTGGVIWEPWFPINNPTFTGSVNGITKSMIGLANVDNTADLSKPISTATQTALDLKANTSSLSSYATTSSLSSYATLSNPAFTGYIQTPRIYEVIQTSYTSFTSNVLTFDYSTGSILYFAGLSTASNFRLALTNVPTTTSRSYTFTLIINTATYRQYANACTINGSAVTPIASGGLANIAINASTVSVLQSFTIVHNSSGYF